MNTSAFWIGALERVLKTVAYTMLAFLGADGANVLSVDWSTALGLSLTAAALSFIGSVISAPIGPNGSPSLVNDRPTDPPAPSPPL